MSKIDVYGVPPVLLLGERLIPDLPEAEQRRQRSEVIDILDRLRIKPGVILADEVGMGKTFVALGVAYAVASQSPRGPVIVMVPANLVDKWEQDLKTFCRLYLKGGRAVGKSAEHADEFRSQDAVRYGVARHSIELMKLLDDRPRDRCHIILLAQGAMSRQQGDKWVRLALIGEALRRHARGGGRRLIQVKGQIHRFVAELIWAVGEQLGSDEGEDLWQTLLRSDPSRWMELYNRSLRPGRVRMQDNPVPKSVVRALGRVELRDLADVLETMPVRDRGGDERRRERIGAVRQQLCEVERELWKQLLKSAKWRSPLLVLDEAHHLKNSETSLARQLQSPDTDADLRTGDGAMAGAFDRMLFLTATPFQLGHRELVNVLRRFGDVRWDDASLGARDGFNNDLNHLQGCLDRSQMMALALQRCWSRMRVEDGPRDGDSDGWWNRTLQSPRDSLPLGIRAVVDAFERARKCRAEAEDCLRPWVIRHNKPQHWVGTEIPRRLRLDGAAICGKGAASGLDIPQGQLLPFFLAARSAASRSQDLLGEALCSSYEAFRYTRSHRKLGVDALDHDAPTSEVDLTHSTWYLGEFDRAIEKSSGGVHPKIAATIKKAVDLWERGEKVLIFAFYLQTCRALRVHLSREIEDRMHKLASEQLSGGDPGDPAAPVEKVVESIQNRYFDRPSAEGRRALDAALLEVLEGRRSDIEAAGMSMAIDGPLMDVMRKFLRVSTTLVRCFPLREREGLAPDEAVGRMLDAKDASGMSWRGKFEAFIDYMLMESTPREEYLKAVSRTTTGSIYLQKGDGDELDPAPTPARSGVRTLANIQVASGLTGHEERSRLMRAFNTPFFPDILVCSQVMGEGVDLQRCCRHVIHHDLAWNPSTIEQRTGRIDRLGCKAEGRQPIHIYLPYLSGTADERQFKVMSEREQWFRVVMGQDKVAELIPADGERETPPLPKAMAEALNFRLGLRMLGLRSAGYHAPPGGATRSGDASVPTQV